MTSAAAPTDGPPNDVGFGFATNPTRSTCAGVRNVRSAVTEVPLAFVATRRKWKVAAGTRPIPGAETFTAAAQNFEEVVGHLFPGGRGALRLVRDDAGPRPVLGGGDTASDEDDAAEPEEAPEDRMGVEIEITPAGKSTKRLTLLSGG